MTTGVSGSESGPCVKIPSRPFFRYENPVSGTVITHIGALVARPEPDIIKHIKLNRMNWMSHIIGIPDDNVVKKVPQFNVSGIRKRRRPRLR
ncbi:hypothetical protein TNCV_4868041 [Trichonephila clavipes]|nr:hypothetical protein TNCV_4868041 [Trichonephila clavipes]